ncbi:STAS domain-containing protein [Streptomyces sp. NPDC045431]|uniref:STAS domain-containing protein n=1 Tax=Streptomyces sp. NPDC045431 TaxID=3155613 RepID=UPI0033D68A92
MTAPATPRHDPLIALGLSLPEHAVACVSVPGRIDITTAGHVRDHLVRTLRVSSGDLYLGMTGVTFFDCSGVGALLAAHRRGARTGRRLILRAASPQVTRVLKIVRVASLFAA